MFFVYVVSKLAYTAVGQWELLATNETRLDSRLFSPFQYSLDYTRVAPLIPLDRDCQFLSSLKTYKRQLAV